MLNRSKVIRELYSVKEQLFINNADEYQLARRVWNSICDDVTLSYKIREVDTSLLIPHWEGALNTVLSVEACSEYTIVSVDGSQIYPDKHQGTPCYLINIGEVVITYGSGQYPVVLNSEPYLFTGYELEQGELKIDVINLQRYEFELRSALVVLKKIAEERIMCPSLALLDGALIFWHLDTKDAVHQEYLTRYIKFLEQFASSKLMMAAYISLPKSRELSNIIRLVLAENLHKEAKDCSIDSLNDVNVVNFFLPPYHRTILFRHKGPIADYYPSQLQPYFFYINVGNEIGRVEVPAWIAKDTKMLNTLAAIILSQSLKGAGYPVALAEAHEQAVVKGADRDFFYHLITKNALEQKRVLTKSQKSIKKRSMRI